MPEQDSLKILFVINPSSGTKDKPDYIETITKYFSGLHHTIQYYYINGKNDAGSLSDAIKSMQPQRVVAVGGDGTVSLVAAQIIDSSIALGILPAGSANGMAKELQIPPSIHEALNVIVHGMVKCSDYIRINEKYICLHLSDIGLNAQLIKYFEESNLRGKLGYARVLIKTLWRRRKMRVSIETKEMQVKRQAFMVVLANASKYGTGAVINPHGRLDDGLFEVIIIRKLSISELLKMLFFHSPFNPEKVETFQAKSVIIETTKKMHFQVDGEYLGRTTRVKAVIEHSKINLVVPQEKMV